MLRKSAAAIFQEAAGICHNYSTSDDREGAVGMVEMALSKLSEGVVNLDEERKGRHGEQPAGSAVRKQGMHSPIVNSGSIY